MKKFKKCFLIVWVCTTVVFFVGLGFFMKRLIHETYVMTGQDSYVDKLHLMTLPLDPEDPGYDDISGAFLIMATQSDWMCEDKSSLMGACAVLYHRILIDRTGNILCNGQIVGVSSRRKDDGGYLEDRRDKVLIGYFSVDETLSKAQISRIIRIKNACEEFGFGMSIDEYIIDNGKYIPKRISVWEGEKKIEEFTGLNPDRDGEVIENQVVWVSGPGRVFWYDDERIFRGRDVLAEWTKNHLEDVFSGKTIFDESGILKGHKSYRVVNDGEYALVMRCEVKGTGLFVLFLFISVVNTLIISAILTYAIHLTVRKEESV